MLPHRCLHCLVTRGYARAQGFAALPKGHWSLGFGADSLFQLLPALAHDRSVQCRCTHQQGTMPVPASQVLILVAVPANPGGRAMIIVGLILLIAAIVVLGGILQAIGSRAR